MVVSGNELCNAAGRGDLAGLKKLLKKALRRHGVSPKQATVEQRRAVLDQTDEGGWTPLCVAACFHRIEVPRWLIRSGASVGAPSTATRSP